VAYKLLKAYMKLEEVTQPEMAQCIGMALSTFNMKLNRKNGADFTLSEASLIASRLNKPVQEIFFTNEISKMKINVS
jgi:putative transcriptional regulator